MKESKVYAAGFAVGLLAAASGLLTLARASLRDRIEANNNYAKIRAVLDAAGLLPPGAGRAETLALYRSGVSERREGGMPCWELRAGGKLVGYALELSVRGRHGPIRGVLAFGPERKKLLGLRFYRCAEPPEIAGKLAAPRWLEQFAGKPCGPAGLLFSTSAAGPNVIRPVSGASATMFSLSRAVNAAMGRFLAGGEELEELDLGLTADTVTKATPGYPKNQPKPPHLRKEVKRPPFLVPKGGTAMLSRGKLVTSSMVDPPIIGDLSQLTDGILKSGPFDYVELDPGPQWVQVDLGAVHTIYAVCVWHFYKNPVIYRDVIVQVSCDRQFKKGVITLFNNDHDNSSGQGRGKDTAYFARWWGELVDARGPENAGTKCRYVRVWTNGGTADEDNRFVEIGVYGRPNNGGQ